MCGLCDVMCERVGAKCVCVWARGEWANLLLHVQVTLLLCLHQLRLALVFIELSSAPGLGSPLPHLHQDWARPCHICARTGLAPATSAPGLDSPQLSSPLRRCEP